MTELDTLLAAIGAKDDEFLTADEIVALYRAIPDATPKQGRLYEAREVGFYACPIGLITYIAAGGPPSPNHNTKVQWGYPFAHQYWTSVPPDFRHWRMGVQMGFDAFDEFARAAFQRWWIDALFASIASSFGHDSAERFRSVSLRGYDTGEQVRELLGVE